MSGIFDATTDLFTVYRATLRFRSKLMGGVPMDPKIIEGWLRSKAGITDAEEIKQATVRTLRELGADVQSFADIAKASDLLASVRSTNGFKVDEDGPYIEARQVKALLKEVTNILYAGQKWGPTRKGPKNYLAERVFIDPDHITLGVAEPTGVELFIGHTTGPQGPQSNLTYHQFCEAVQITFEVKTTEDSIAAKDWPRIWVQAQEVGLGALRAQGFGRFDILGWDRLPG